MATKTADYIWFNGEMLPWAEANVHVLTHAMHYGTSVLKAYAVTTRQKDQLSSVTVNMRNV